MGKLFICLSLLTLNSCHAKKNEDLKALDYLRQNQNIDGSWGDKNKIHCTSVAILTYFISFETPSSKEFGKSVSQGLNFLIAQEEKVTQEDLQLYFWSISEAYGFIGSVEIAALMKRQVPKFKTSISWDFKNEPQKFFIQNQALHAFRKSFIDIEAFEPFLTKLDQLTDYDSLAILLTKRQWKKRTKLNETFEEKIIENSQNLSTSYLDDMILGRYIFLESFHEYAKLFQEKMESYINGQNKYTFDDRYTPLEKKLLEKTTPKLVYEFSFPMRYLPTSRTTQTEEGLNLVK